MKQYGRSHVFSTLMKFEIEMDTAKMIQHDEESKHIYFTAINFISKGSKYKEGGSKNKPCGELSSI